MLGLPTGTTFDVLGSVLMSTILAIEQHLHDMLLSYLDALHLLLPLDAFTFHYNYRRAKLHHDLEVSSFDSELGVIDHDINSCDPKIFVFVRGLNNQSFVLKTNWNDLICRSVETWGHTIGICVDNNITSVTFRVDVHF